MRGDGVGVGDISEVSDWARGTRYSACGDDGGRSGRERDAGVVCGLGIFECDASRQPCWHGVHVCHSARGEHGARELHEKGS